MLLLLKNRRKLLRPRRLPSKYERDRIDDDLSNTETPENGPQIGYVEFLKSDSIRNEALLPTVVYVESDVGDSGVARNSLDFVFII